MKNRKEKVYTFEETVYRREEQRNGV